MRSPGYSSCSVCPPVWVLDGLLRFRIFSFEPLSSSPLRILMKLVLIFCYLGCSHKGKELQVVSHYVSFASPGAYVASVPNFLTKTESSSHSLPRSLLVKCSFWISLWAWTRTVAVFGQYPARVYPEDALVGIRPRCLFLFCLY